MKQENYRNKRKINRLTTALVGIFFYILLTLILKTVQNLFTPGGTLMGLFSLVEFVLVSAFMVAYTWYNFRNASLENSKSFWKYILFVMIPIAVMTLLTIMIMYVGSGASFNKIWNAVTFIIAPTLFLYIPFGFIYDFLSVIPLAVFMIVCLIYMVGLQYAGYILGAPSRKFALERERKRMEQDALVMRRQDEMARQASKAREVQEQIRQTQKQNIVMDQRDPLKDIESTPVVETEAFDPITDDMVAEAERRQMIRSHQQKIEARKKRRMEALQQEINKGDGMASSQIDSEHMEALKQRTKNLEQELAQARERLAE